MGPTALIYPSWAPLPGLSRSLPVHPSLFLFYFFLFFLICLFTLILSLPHSLFYYLACTLTEKLYALFFFFLTKSFPLFSIITVFLPSMEKTKSHPLLSCILLPGVPTRIIIFTRKERHTACTLNIFLRFIYKFSTLFQSTFSRSKAEGTHVSRKMRTEENHTKICTNSILNFRFWIRAFSSGVHLRKATFFKSSIKIISFNVT